METKNKNIAFKLISVVQHLSKLQTPGHSSVKRKLAGIVYHWENNNCVATHTVLQLIFAKCKIVERLQQS